MISKNPLVLYGAGRNAETEKATLEESGEKCFVCFIDADAQKQGTEFLGLPIFSLDEAMAKYGKFNIYVTVAKPLRFEIFAQLMQQGIARENILNYEEIQLGCPEIESGLVAAVEGLMFCCRIKNGDFVSPRIKWKASFEETLVEWVAKREDISEVIKASKPHKCKDCPIITKMPLSAQKKICSLTYSLPFLCQFSCIYCKSEERNLKEEANQFWKSFDLTRIIRHLEEHCLISKKATIFFGGGEITIFPYKHELLSSIKEYNVHIPTNALIFDSFVAELTARPGSVLSISPDAGTKETFRLIKGVSAFDDVWKSIARYSELGSNIDLKYIFLPENSNCSDVEGFVYRATNAGVNRIYCSTNYYRNESLSAQQIDAVVKMTDMAKKCGITILRDYSFKNEENDEICRQLECS